MAVDITALASDDEIVVLSGTNGENQITYRATHAKKGPSSGYTSGNTTTKISGSGEGTILIPQLTVDTYGHVTTATDEPVKIEIPAGVHVGTEEPTNGEAVWIDTDEEPTSEEPTSGGSIDVTAEVGQTIIVKEVDENGKSTKWKAADYQPRTHWTEDVLLFDGVVEDEIDGNLVFFAAAPTIGNTYKITYNGMTYSCVGTDSAVFGEAGACILGNVALAMGTGDTGEPFVFTYLDDAWFVMMFDGVTSPHISVTEVVYTPIPVEYLPDSVVKTEDIKGGVEVGQTIIVKEVDENGKPTKWEAADYQPRTHWSEENVVTDIVPQITYTPKIDPNLGGTVYHLPQFELEEGKTYTVVFDGLEYSCQPMSGALGNMTFIGIGNPVFAGGPDNGMPFCVADVDARTTITGGGVTEVLGVTKVYAVLGMDEAQHTVRVIGEKTVHTKIPDVYVDRDFIIRIPYNNGYVMATPWEQVIDAIKAGRNVIAMSEGGDWEFDEYGQVSSKAHEINRWYLLNSKIGWLGFEQSCKLIFIGIGSNSLFLRIKRDAEGITTVEETDNPLD